jgi:hypothetical protein
VISLLFIFSIFIEDDSSCASVAVPGNSLSAVYRIHDGNGDCEYIYMLQRDDGDIEIGRSGNNLLATRYQYIGTYSYEEIRGIVSLSDAGRTNEHDHFSINFAPQLTLNCVNFESRWESHDAI